MPRALIVINSLGPGGAERVFVNVLSRKPADWDARVALLDDEPDYRSLPPGVAFERLDCRRRLGASIAATHRAIRAHKPDVAISFLIRANVATALAARALGVPSVISERMHPSAHLASQFEGLARVAAKSMMVAAYPRATRVIAVSRGTGRDLIERFGVSPARVAVLPNPYDLEAIASSSLEAPEVPLPDTFFVGVGRLTKSKAFGDLIDAFAISGVDGELCIIGEGEDLRALKARAAAAGVGARVRFLGYLRNPFAVVRRARALVSASRTEGFPNAIAEALALGVPVIAADCPSGPSEILAEQEHGLVRAVHEGRFGVLTPVASPEQLADAMRRMTDNAYRARYSALGRQRLQDFAIDAVAARYWAEFAAATG
ncbi:MAG: glycosyltransferase [Alphaproteobacteria bacterium]|nr:glycosyltransferase [Alphaproteobacteria bacterium]